MPENNDLYVLAADKSMEAVLAAGLSRPASLNIRPVSVHTAIHPGKDGGARTSGVALLATQVRRFKHALLVFDYEGSGAKQPPVELERQLDEQLAAAWEGRAKAIVIDPEVDVWLWGSDNALVPQLGWSQNLTIREWLDEAGFSFNADGKPDRPKEAIEAVLRVCRIPRSAATYRKVIEKISLKRCTDHAFLRLADRLGQWFPI